MSEEQPKMKVVDRRRFIQEGENIRENPNARPEEPTPIVSAEPEKSAPAEPGPPAAEHDVTGATQAQAQAGTQAAMEAAEMERQARAQQGRQAQPQPEQAPQQAGDAEEKKQTAERRADQAAAGLPPADVVTLVEFIAQQVSLYLGEPDPMGRSIKPNLPAAGLFIDLLGVLKEKTEGKLNLEEQHALDQVLTALRLRYVQMRS